MNYQETIDSALRKAQAGIWDGHYSGKGVTVEYARAVDAEIKVALVATEKLQNWVNDLQSGMYVNCVYCGHRYGPNPDTPVAMAEVLKAHIEECPQHPLSVMRALARDLAKALADLYPAAERAMPELPHQGSCGPEAGCDGICVEVATIFEWLRAATLALDRAKKAGLLA